VKYKVAKSDAMRIKILKISLYGLKLWLGFIRVLPRNTDKTTYKVDAMLMAVPVLSIVLFYVIVFN
jgi:hypothetical protein